MIIFFNPLSTFYLAEGLNSFESSRGRDDNDLLALGVLQRALLVDHDGLRSAAGLLQII